MTTTRTSILAMAATVLGVAALTAVPAMAAGPGPMYQNQPQHYGYGHNYDRDSLGGCWVWMNGARHWSFNCGTSGVLYYGESDYYGGPDYYAGPTVGFSFGDGPYYRHHWHR